MTNNYYKVAVNNRTRFWFFDDANHIDRRDALNEAEALSRANANGTRPRVVAFRWYAGLPSDVRLVGDVHLLDQPVFA